MAEPAWDQRRYRVGYSCAANPLLLGYLNRVSTCCMCSPQAAGDAEEPASHEAPAGPDLLK